MESLNTQTAPGTSLSHPLKVFFLFLVVLGFISAFIGGYFLSNLLAKEKIPNTTKSVNASPISTPVNLPTESQDSTKFIPGKHYFEDTIIAITKDSPQHTLVATVTRNEQNSNYIQASRTSFYDGTKWIRKSETKEINDSTIVSGNIVKSWDLTIDPSRVLKQTYQGNINVENNSINVTSGILQNEISVRSLPGYTKFMSVGNGTVTINGNNSQAYIIYTRIYSQNASDIQFYNDPFGLTTDWIAFWDNQGNFYHIDSTFVDKATSTYQTHQLGIMEKADGSVTKTFSVTVDRDSKNPPEEYTVSLGSPINTSLRFKRVNEINKAPDGSYSWYMGNIEGSSPTSVGLVEYIHH